MIYCLNPYCPRPENPSLSRFCHHCGTQLALRDRYLAIQPLGEGGMGRTFLAEDRDRLGEPCVIKQFLPSADIQKSDRAMAKAVQLFEQEARRLIQLGHHPQIPILMGYFIIKNPSSRKTYPGLYLVQEWIDGLDLHQELFQLGAFSEAKIHQLLNKMLPVFQFIHQYHVIHRDIKPHNIMRRRSGELVLIDFGVAKELTKGAKTVTGSKVGTEGYAAVEQLRGGKAYPASDLYSLGVTCIQLLTNAELDRLFDPQYSRWRWQEYLTSQGKTVSDRLSYILNKMLQDSLQNRYQSAGEILKDLQSNLSVSPLTAQPKIAPPKIAPPKVSVTSTRQPFPHSPGKSLQKHQSSQTKNQIRGIRGSSWRYLRSLTSHTWPVLSIAISSDNQFLVSGSADYTIKIWELQTSRLIATLRGHSEPVYAVAMSPDNQHIVSGSSDNTIKIWELSTGELISTLTGHSDSVYSVAISPDGQTIASGSWDNTIKLWNLPDSISAKSGQPICTFTGHSDWVYSLAFSPDGQMLASGSWDRTVKLWNIAKGKLIRSLLGHSDRIFSVAFSPHKQMLASASWDKTIKLWDLSTGKVIHTLIGHRDRVFSIAFHPQEKILVSGSWDNTIKLWNIDTGKLIRTLTKHSDTIWSVVFSADGQTLACGTHDHLIQIWRAD